MSFLRDLGAHTEAIPDAEDLMRHVFNAMLMCLGEVTLPSLP